MKKKQILWAIVFGSMLAITGCGDDPVDNTGGAGSGGSGGSAGSGGSGGTGGSVGSGGNNGGPSSSTCEAICTSSCVFNGVDPDGQQCLTNCEVGLAQFDDECGPQADAFLDCIESVNCDPEATECQSEAIGWGTCIAGI
jgi:hypothetical protein